MKILKSLLFATVFLSMAACTTANIEKAKIEDRIELAKAAHPVSTAIAAFRECVGTELGNVLIVKACNEITNRELERAENTANASGGVSAATVVVSTDSQVLLNQVIPSIPTCPPNAYGCTSGAPPKARTQQGTYHPFVPAMTSGGRRY